MVNSLLEAVEMSETQYHSLLRYDNCPRADVAVKIANFLDTSVEYMVTGHDPSDIPSDIMAQVRRLMSLDKVRRTPILANIKAQVDFWKTEEDTSYIVASSENNLPKEDEALLESYHNLSDRDRLIVNSLISSLNSIKA